MATRDIRRGELVMEVPALAVTLFKSVTPKQHAYELDNFGFDATTVALSLSALATQEGRSIVAALDIGAHSEPKAAAHVASRLRQRHPRALPRDIASLSDAELGALCLKVKSNVHRCHDDETATHAIGLGLYPPAAMFNHSCSPRACFSWSADGRVMHVRALTDVSRGEEVTVSYLAEEQLYAPWEDRRALLREAFGYVPTNCLARQRAEEATMAHGAPSVALRQRVHDVLGNVRRALATASAGAAGAAGAAGRAARSDALADALTQLRGLIDVGLQGAVHPFHWLVQEAQAALLALARTSEVDEPPLVAQSALHLIAAREALMPVGTLHLAALYAAHGSALCRLLGTGSVQADERAQVATAAVKSLTAAQAIRTTCLGDAHPIAKATGAALQHARDALK